MTDIIINYGYDTQRAAQASLREYSPALRAEHRIVKYYDTTKGRHRYSRVLVGKHEGRLPSDAVATELAIDQAYHRRQALR